MTRLRFIKPWGNFAKGDIKETESKTTVMWLVDNYKVAVIDRPAKRIVFEASLTEDAKKLDMPVKDKMVRGATKEK